MAMFRSKSRDETATPQTEANPAGFVRRLRARLNRGDSWLTYDLANLLPKGRIDEETLEELETRLVSRRRAGDHLHHPRGAPRQGSAP